MRAGRIILIVAGTLLLVLGFGVAAVGGTLIVIHGTQRDGTGYYRSSTEIVYTSTSALTARLDLGSPRSGFVPARPLGTVQIRAASTTGHPVFLGVGPAAAVDRWLAGVPHERAVGVRTDPFSLRTTMAEGTSTAPAPRTQTWWAASTSGSGQLTLTWPSQRGHWVVVLANADASPGVAARLSVGTNTDIVLTAGLVTGGIGLLAVIGGVLMIVAGARRLGAPRRPAVVPPPVGVSGR